MQLELTEAEREALLCSVRVSLHYTGTSEHNMRHLKNLWPKLGGDPKEIKKGD